MAADQSTCSHGEDDYIDMEVSSSSSKFLSYSINGSPPHQNREFEFQMSSVSHDRETTTFPADELFYKGKLLPLHLPPRLQMVQKLLQTPTATSAITLEENCGTINPFIASSSCSAINTSLEFCNISPSESCRVSSELNPDEYFFEWSTEICSFIGDHQKKKSWTKKLRHSTLGQKLKASRAYLKGLLFSKSGCTDESSCPKAKMEPAETAARGRDRDRDCFRQYMKVAKKNPFGKIDNYERYNTLKKSIEKEMAEEGLNYTNNSQQRKSFSGAIQWHSSTKSSISSSSSSLCLSSTSSSGSSSSSSSFSLSSNGFYYDLQWLKRSSSANSEIENSIEGAIAHCKKSHQPQQQIFTTPTKNANDEGAAVSSFPHQERPKSYVT